MSAVAKEQAGSAFKTKLDPITFEILRNRLFAINEEAATTMKLVSGSTIANEANDMNTALMDADGDVVVVARYSLAKATTMSMVVKDILRNYAENPGINPGDGFLCNDVYLGVQHQNDVAFVMPFFHQGKLRAWVGAEVHQIDVGGPVPGSVQVGAKDIFGEAPLMPPIKIVEKHAIRHDIERNYLRRSRLPGPLGLDLRAKWSACNVACQRLEKLIERYGISNVTQAMVDTLNYAAARFGALLASLPDGTWRHVTYMDYDGDVYPIRIAMTKDNDRLKFDFTGTARQAPAVVNCTRTSLEAVLLGYAVIPLGWDIPWSPSALHRLVDIVTEHGTVVDCRWPAGCSKSTTSISWSVGKAVGLLIGRMLACSDHTRHKAMASWIGSMTVEEVFGEDEQGNTFGGLVIDTMAGAGGARTFRDGIDTGGYLGSMGMAIANVETYELEHPIMYLYRRQEVDGGGAGTFRGGSSIRKAYTVHGVKEISGFVTHCVGVEMPLSPGIYGGYPAGTNQLTVKRGTDLWRQLSMGGMPDSINQLHGSDLEIHSGISRSPLQHGDVFEGGTMGGGGYGDPIERDPNLVLRDLASGLVSVGSARELYGVIAADGVLDEKGTLTLREQIRARRKSDGRAGRRAPRVSKGLRKLRTIGQRLQLLEGTDGVRFLGCSCGQVLSPAEENYKTYVLECRRPLSAGGPQSDPFQLGASFEFREYYCPNCASLLEVDMLQKNEPIVWDLELA